MKAIVYVDLKNGVLDPQGKAVSETLTRLDELVDLGVRYFIIWPTGFDYELLEWLESTVLNRYESVE